MAPSSQQPVFEPSHMPPILVLTPGGLIPCAVIEHLSQCGFRLHVLFEPPEKKLEVMRRRAKKLGMMVALGQLVTMVASRLLKSTAKKRISALLQQHGLKGEIPSHIPQAAVSSVNAPDLLTHIEAIRPAAILLLSTRLMQASQLARISCPVINLHAGINPQYRGQMGAYWALRKNDPENFGATLHLVDAGTDTGDILYRAYCQPQPGDFISTYPLTVTLAALDVTALSLKDALTGTLNPQPAIGPSGLYFPPTIWSWIWHGIWRRIW